MPGRPRVSCDKCRAQKLRCSGQTPSCQRCRRLGRPCVYQKAPSSQARSRSPVRTQLSIPAAVPAELSPSDKSDNGSLGVPATLVPVLVELYFDHVYNASLLLRRQSFKDDVAAGTVRTDVLLAICALGSIFYKDTYNQTVLVDNGFSHDWADRASRLCFQEVQSPREENLVSLLTLALFWYSRGEFRRASMHECCASNTAFVIGLPTRRSVTRDPLQSEISRRRFWACYVLSCFQAWTLFPKTPSEAVLNLGLPCRDDDFDTGMPQGSITLMSEKGNGSIYAELVKVITLWSAVESLVKQPESSLSVRLADIQALDGRIHTSWANVPVALQLDVRNMSLVSPDHLPGKLLVQIMYYQCLCALHSSIVPLFSWSTSDDTYLYARQVSGQTALDYANAVSSLLEAAMDLHCQASRFAAFIGYAAYCACAIQMPFLWCQNHMIKQRTVRNVLTNLKTIHEIGRHWKNIHVLGKYAHRLYKANASRPFPIEDEPKNMTASAMSGSKQGAARARLSILTHNKIFVEEEGALAKQIEDITDLDLQDVNGRNATTVENGNIVNLMSEIRQEEQIWNYQLPIMTDPFVAFNDFSLADSEFNQTFSDGFSGYNQIGSIEDWFSSMQEVS